MPKPTCASELLEQLLALRFGLFLHGIPEYRNNLIALGGIDNEGGTSVRHIETPGRAYCHRFGRRPTITAESLASRSVCANRILALHGNQGAFRLVRAGFRACTRGMEEPEPAERLHQYVRALDGLTMLRPGEGANLFSQRAQLFAVGTNIADVLVQPVSSGKMSPYLPVTYSLKLVWTLPPSVSRAAFRVNASGS